MLWLETIAQDLQYAIRSLRSNPVLTTTTVLTLALGIGVNVGIFTVLSGVFLRPPVDKEPDSFVHLSPDYTGDDAPDAKPWAVSVRDYQAYQKGTRTMRVMSGWDNARVVVGSDGGSSVFALLVTCNFFDVYGLDQPRLGRLFLNEECSTPGSSPVVVISDDFWKGQLGADPQIIGKAARLNRNMFTVVGVTPPGFAGAVKGPGIWIPYTMQSWFGQPGLGGGKDFFKDPGARWLTAEGRLRPGFSRADTHAELAVIASRQDLLVPGRKTTMRVTNGSLAQEPALRSSVIWIGPLIMGALTLLLAIACTNVTVLQLSRAAARKREMGIRLSLGAGRRRLIRMLLTESLLLASLAACVSAVVVYDTPIVLAKLMKTSNSPAYAGRLDWMVFAYLAIVAVVAACMAGLTPAAESLRVDLATSMKGGLGLFTAGSKRRSRSTLVAVQVAMSLVLLAGAGFFLRAQYSMFHANPGFETEHVLMVPVRLDMPPYTPESAQSFTATLLTRIRSLPGVRTVAFGPPPMAENEDGQADQEVRLPGQDKGAGQQAVVSSVSAGYLDALGISVTRGRAFLESDSSAEHAQSIAVVSRAFALKFWPDRAADPIGKTIVMRDGQSLVVVGEARDVKPDNLSTAADPHVYQLRNPRAFGDPLLVQFAGDPHAVELAVRQAVQNLDRQMIVTPKTLRAVIDDVADKFSVVVQMVGALAGVALALAVIGIYGVLAFTVRQRMKEFGVRAALGATGPVIVRSVLSSGFRTIMVGLVCGGLMALAGAEALSRIFRDTPIAVQPLDLPVYAAVSLILAVAAVGAMVGPALRAARADPVQALRQE